MIKAFLRFLVYVAIHLVLVLAVLATVFAMAFRIPGRIIEVCTDLFADWKHDLHVLFHLVKRTLATIYK